VAAGYAGRSAVCDAEYRPPGRKEALRDEPVLNEPYLLSCRPLSGNSLDSRALRGGHRNQQHGCAEAPRCGTQKKPAFSVLQNCSLPQGSAFCGVRRFGIQYLPRQAILSIRPASFPIVQDIAGLLRYNTFVC
jgi:hypothetical protein